MTTVAAAKHPLALTPPAARQPLCLRGKFFFEGDEKLYIKGVTYGPFRPGEHGEYGTPRQVRIDLERMAAYGINTLRIYTVPPEWFMDAASDAGLRVLAGVPWAQHLPFLEQRQHRQEALANVKRAAEQLGDHPALLAISVGNEIPGGVVRWYGHRRIERLLRDLCDQVRQVSPGALVTYVNYPPTEYLELPFLDFAAFNVFLERREQLEGYLARLQTIAGDRPLVMTEIGLDSIRNGESEQARSVAWQLRSVFESGAAGGIVFSWTDEWFRGGNEIEDWAFGLTTRARRPKPALASVQGVFEELPCVRSTLPSASVVVCTYNGGRTIRRTLEALSGLDYPDYEVLVIDDGSKDHTASIAAEFPVRLIRTENRGLSSARNTGYRESRGEIVAYIDDDAYPDPHWLQYLARTLQGGHAGAGGPNLPVRGDTWVAACVDCTPGNPTHVLLSDTVAEHVPGCNMAFWKWALEEVGGFDTQFRIAGDDVDLCWRLHERGCTLGFSAAAVVWHHRRNRVKTFWRQQVNYGRAEAALERKWPEKYNAVGHAIWTGRLYAGPHPPLLVPERRRIYHGVWGAALFQHVYPTRHSFVWALTTMPEWYAVLGAAVGLSLLGLVWPAMLLFAPIAGLMLLLVVAQASVHAVRARLPHMPGSGFAELGMRVMVGFLYLMQPIARLRGRLIDGLTPLRLRGVRGFASPSSQRLETWAKRWQDPAARLAALEQALKRGGAVVLRGHEFARWDLELRGGLFGRLRISQFTADLAHSAQYVQLRAVPRVAPMGWVLFLLLVAICAAAIRQDRFLLAGSAWLIAAGMALLCARELSACSATFRRHAGRIMEECT